MQHLPRHEWGDGGEGLHYFAIMDQLRDIAERAHVQKRVNPHNFPHSRSTHLASRLTESQMEEYLGWVQGSRMPSIYVHMSGRDLDADLLQMYGLKAETAKEAPLEIQQCPYCKAVNTRGAQVCMTCKRPIAIEEVMDREALVMEYFRDIVDMLALHPETKAKFIKRLEG